MLQITGNLFAEISLVKTEKYVDVPSPISDKFTNVFKQDLVWEPYLEKTLRRFVTAVNAR